MVGEEDTARHGLLQAAAEVVGRVVVDQGAGVGAHPAVPLHHHLAERAHERATGLRRLDSRHAVLGHVRDVQSGAGGDF